MSIIEVDGNIIGGYLSSKNDSALLTFHASAQNDVLQGHNYGANWAGGDNWVPWYVADGNRFPLTVIKILTENNINPRILDTKRDFIIGNGIVIFKNSYNKGKRQTVLLDPKDYPEISSFITHNDYNTQCRKIAKDILWFGNGFSELVFRAKKVAELRHIDASTCRAEKNSGSGIENYFICDNWQAPKWDTSDPLANKKGNNVARIPAYISPDKIKAWDRCIVQLKDYLPGYPYYALPSWYGALNWIKLANTIPVWHLSGMKNGYNIKMHIEVPDSYFSALEPEKQNEARRSFLAEMNRWLSGEDNVGKAFVSYLPQHGNEFDRFKITPINANLNDEAFTALFEQSNIAMTSAHGINPSLAGVEIPGRLGSGSELRNAYHIYLSLHTNNIRQLLLQPIKEIAKINNWGADIQFGFENIEITKLDENPMGKQSVIAH